MTSPSYEGKWEAKALGQTPDFDTKVDFDEQFRDKRTPIEKIADATLLIAEALDRLSRRPF